MVPAAKYVSVSNIKNELIGDLKYKGTPIICVLFTYETYF